MTQTIREMLESYLRMGGYDGLWSPDGGCACWLRDLMPCAGPVDECRPGVVMIDEDGEPAIGEKP